ncbi:hypothetical protein AGOR_G00142250 [Albula goreensis]|uniref:Galactose-3-O-sulfotransferase 2-like n=1 Tax=Albula goreensis TaxID=1534307 RepID=A0A8T3D0X6_9TELE|nr:hypothetical protein AGOR_G00142250 [Albula goreensis]
MHPLFLKTLLFGLIMLIILTAVSFLQLEDFTSCYKVTGKTRNTDNVAAPSCSPRRNVMFLKTHKTGSTTVQNMLLRYADSRNLNVAIPKDRKTFEADNLFSAKYVDKYQENGTSFNFITHHLRFNSVQLKKVLKAKDTFYFTIIRHPVSQMESAFSFFRRSFAAFKAAKSLEDFLKNANKYYDPASTKGNNELVKNPAWFDFGYDSTGRYSEHEIAKALLEIGKSFDLILITEYFDESMILLKEAMCWDIDDVVTFKHNSRNESDRKNISQDVASRIQDWNSLDWRLYNHFNVTFWAKLEEMFSPARLQEELAILREKRKLLETQCCEDGLFIAKKPGTKGAYFKKFLHMTFQKGEFG